MAFSESTGCYGGKLCGGFLGFRSQSLTFAVGIRQSHVFTGLEAIFHLLIPVLGIRPGRITKGLEAIFHLKRENSFFSISPSLCFSVSLKNGYLVKVALKASKYGGCTNTRLGESR